MILVTGAAGKTGRAVVRALADIGAEVRAFVRREEQGPAAIALGAQEAVVGDLGDRVDIDRAVAGIESVYLICPNVDPREMQYAELMIEAAVSVGVKQFGYHSVLHPQTQRMPHHWQKLRVEEVLFQSGLPFTIIQPSAYMQNLLAQKQTILDSGILRVPYSLESRFSLVDLEDVSTVVAKVLTDPGHRDVIYELAGSEALSHLQIAATIGAQMGCQLRVQQISQEEWVHTAQQGGLGDHQIGTLRLMFDYYDCFGLRGNSNVLTFLLGHAPNTLEHFVRREMVS